MREKEWLRSRDYAKLLHWARPRFSARKKRLLVVAACRLALADHPAWSAVLDVVERYAEGSASPAEMRSARRQAARSGHTPLVVATYLSGSECCNALHVVPWPSRRGTLADLVREVFGNPFRPARVDPAALAWGGGQAVRLAEAIYDEQAFDRLPVLGDALEEAGCDDEALLAHCREPGRHVRGCWGLDLVLGKA